MAHIFKPTYTKRDPATGRRVVKKTKKWYVKYRDEHNILRKVAGFTDKESTRQLGAQLEREAQQIRAGLLDPIDRQKRRPLAEHLDEYKAHLRGKERSHDHISTTLQRIESMFTYCGAVYVADVSVSKVEAFLAGLCDSGRSLSTRNHYLRAEKMLFKWMIKTRRLDENPISSIDYLNEGVDRRRIRRAATPDEFNRLLQATASGPEELGLTGPQRVVLYILAVYTGGRRNELGSIRPSSFDFAAEPPIMRIAARHSKRRMDDTVPLRADLAKLVERWITDQELWATDQPLFDITDKKTADMLKVDLTSAGIAYRDERGRTLDFHALRSTFVTNLARAGVTPKAAQTLARHSDIRLTMNVYTSIEMSDQAAAVAQLPAVPTIPLAEQKIESSPTNVIVSAIENKKLVPQLVLTDDFSCPKVTSPGKNASSAALEKTDRTEARKSCQHKAVDAKSHPVTSDDNEDTGGGTRTHTSLRTLDFESSASANSATPAGVEALNLWHRAAFVNGVRPTGLG